MGQRLYGLLGGALAALALAAPASADVCDYRLSKLINSEVVALGAAAPGTVAATGTAASALGFYTLVHSTSGLTMLGSTMAGSSAAGTVGIIGGTGGVIGSTAAFVMFPATIAGAAVLAVGTGAYEGACFFMIDRVTDYDQVLPIVQAIAATNPAQIRYIENTTLEGFSGPAIVVTDEDDISTEYAIENLYIADGELKNYDWFFNTSVMRLDDGILEQAE